VEVVGEVLRLHGHDQLYALAFLGEARGAGNGCGDGRGGLCGDGFIPPAPEVGEKP
jgi:hypothetical protein